MTSYMYLCRYVDEGVCVCVCLICLYFKISEGREFQLNFLCILSSQNICYKSHQVDHFVSENGRESQCRFSSRWLLLCFTPKAADKQCKGYKSDKHAGGECISPSFLFAFHRGIPTFWWYWQATQSETSAMSQKLRIVGFLSFVSLAVSALRNNIFSYIIRK